MRPRHGACPGSSTAVARVQCRQGTTNEHELTRIECSEVLFIRVDSWFKLSLRAIASLIPARSVTACAPRQFETELGCGRIPLRVYFGQNRSERLLRRGHRRLFRRHRIPYMLFYCRVFLTFFRNSLIRELMFPANFVIQVITRLFWFFARVALFGMIYKEVDHIQEWSKHEYFAFMATGMLINAIVEAFFMPNCAAFCENIRTGKLDFALTKPVDSQFLVSMEKISLAMVSQLMLAAALLVYSLYHIGQPVTVVQVLMFLFYVIVAVAFFYSMMITTACTSIWFGRNQGLYDFWFYITIFAQYPRSIYDGHNPGHIEPGEALQFAFSWVVPILLVVTVPAQAIVGTLTDWRFAAVAVIAAVFSLVISRGVFLWSLNHYRGASS